MTSLIVLDHPVADFAAWKRAFDADPIGRAAGGVLSHSILRPVDDPDSVLVSLEFAAAGEAEAFLARLRGLWRQVGDRIGFDPAAVRARVVEEVERVDYTVSATS